MASQSKVTTACVAYGIIDFLSEDKVTSGWYHLRMTVSTPPAANCLSISKALHGIYLQCMFCLRIM